MAAKKVIAILGKVGEEYSKSYVSEEYIAKWTNSLGCLDFLNGKTGEILDPFVPGWCYQFEEMFDIKIDWPEGKCLLPDGRKMKLGKWLKKNKLTILPDTGEDLLYALETRKSLKYKWKITTCPEEVLAMSYNRAWTSCMRPYGDYSRGPFSECNYLWQWLICSCRGYYNRNASS